MYKSATNSPCSLLQLRKKIVSFSYFTMTPFLIPLALFLIFLYIWRRNDSSTSRKILPPSPRKLPVIGNLHQLGLLPHRSLQSLSRRYGPLMMLHLGRVPVLFVSSADAAREIMKNQDVIFSNRPKLSIPDRLLYGSKDVGFAPYGEYWRQVRSICVLQLLSVKRVQSFHRVREEETSLMIEKIRRLGSKTVINLSDMFSLLTNDVVCRVALGRKYTYGEEGLKFKILLSESGELLGTFRLGDYIPWLAWTDRVTGLSAKVESVAKRFDGFLESVVEEHRSKKKGEIMAHGGNNSDAATGSDFVDILLQVQRENKDTSPFEDDAIKAIIFDMFAAGTETTYTSLEWTMAELLRHPNIMEKLQKEVRRVAGGKEEITEDDLEKMHYLKAVVKESLRLHAPVPLLIPRESTQDTKLMGYDIAAGTRIMINAWAIARDPSLWENPEQFHPERFLDTNIDYKGLHYELIPFGAGRRGCPGITFAMAIKELALAKLMHKFNFGLPGGASKNDLDMSETAGIAVQKRLPLLVVATEF